MDRMSYQFEADEEDGTWQRIAVWDGADPLGPINGESFELGEPVYVASSFHDLDHADLRVFWIRHFSDKGSYEDAVVLHHTRYGVIGTTSISPARLRKLPAMLRIAHEATE